MNGFREYDITMNSNNEYGIAIDNGALLDTKTVEYTSNQTGTVLINGVDGYLTEVRGLVIHTEATSGEVNIYFDSGNFIKLYASKDSQLSISNINIRGNEGENLKITTTTGANKVYIGINYIIRKRK